MQPNLNHPQMQHQTNQYFQNSNTSPEIISLQKGLQPSEGKKKGKKKNKNESNSGNKMATTITTIKTRIMLERTRKRREM